MEPSLVCMISLLMPGLPGEASGLFLLFLQAAPSQCWWLLCCAIFDHLGVFRYLGVKDVILVIFSSMIGNTRAQNSLGHSQIQLCITFQGCEIYTSLKGSQTQVWMIALFKEGKYILLKRNSKSNMDIRTLGFVSLFLAMHNLATNRRWLASLIFNLLACVSCFDRPNKA